MRGTKAMTFVTVMILVALVSLFLRFSVEQLLRWNITQDEANAKETLKLVSAALENYARDHQGLYPAALAQLCDAKPPYIGKAYTQMGTIRGYVFECSVLDASGYACSAVPLRCKLTGTAVYKVTTGGSLSTGPCGSRE